MTPIFRVALLIGVLASLALVARYATAHSHTPSTSTHHTTSDEAPQGVPPPTASPDRPLNNKEQAFVFQLWGAINKPLKLSVQFTSDAFIQNIADGETLTSGFSDEAIDDQRKRLVQIKNITKTFDVEESQEDIKAATDMIGNDSRLIYISKETLGDIHRMFWKSQYGSLNTGDGNQTDDAKVILIGVKDGYTNSIRAFQGDHFTTTINGQTYHIL